MIYRTAEGMGFIDFSSIGGILSQAAEFGKDIMLAKIQAKAMEPPSTREARSPGFSEEKKRLLIERAKNRAMREARKFLQEKKQKRRRKKRKRKTKPIYTSPWFIGGLILVAAVGVYVAVKK